MLDRRRIGLMCQPRSNPARSGWLWAADNDCFSEKWTEASWLAWLGQDHPRSGCLFAVVPDVVADAAATLARFDEYAAAVRDLRYPLALAAQNGLEDLDVPWDRFDCLFIGGTTEWKVGEASRALAAEARSRSKWVHVGRINSDKRFRTWAKAADSCDGTYVRFGPTINAPKMERWLDNYEASPQFDLAAPVSFSARNEP